MSFQLMLLILFLLLLILAALALLCLSILTPWPERPKSYFYASRYLYRKNMDIDEPFSHLLTSGFDEKSHGSQTTKPQLYLTVIVPAMNEELRLPLMLEECLEYLEDRAHKNVDFTYEVIIVDDGSSDATADVAYSYAKNYPLSVLRLSKNLGKGGAVREGMLCARGQFILFADADGATRFADFSKMERQMKILCNGENSSTSEPADWTHPALVVGSRAHLEKDSIATRSLFRTILMIGFHTLVWMFTVRTVRDTQCGFKLFSRSAAAKLFTKLHIERWAFDVELIYLAEQLHFSLAEVAVQWTEIDGSKITPLFSWLQMGRDILLICRFL